jgi:6-pyruvoyltetrahydropterin/6-carboxytetrahydropterin synthase
MLILKRHFSFCASHRLYNPNFSDEKNKLIFGKCSGKNGHGHNYKLEVSIKGNIDPETGMMFNLQKLKDIVNESIINDVDHKHLNFDVSWLQGKIPTTEIFVECIWERLEEKLAFEKIDNIQLQSITVWETENNIVTKTRD